MEMFEFTDAVDDAVQQAEIIESTAQAIYDAMQYGPNTIQTYQKGLYGVIQSMISLKKDLAQIRDDTYGCREGKDGTEV